MRLFFALWPDPATQLAWYDRVSPLLRQMGGRRMPAASLHLTLHFLGETPVDRLPALLDLGADLAREAIALRFDRLECWKKAELLCLRAEEPPELQRLIGRLATGLSLLGLPVERRRFKAHVTLARRLACETPSLPLWPVLEWRAPALALVRSRLSQEGAEYTPLAQWPLGETSV